MADEGSRGGRWSQWGWFVLIWAASVAALVIVAYGLRRLILG